MENTTEQVPTVTEEWVEPEISDLEVRDTSYNPSSGGDGGVYPDCTRS